MIVRKLRLQRGWSQDQLSQFTGLNVRTIQRIEKGHKAGLESLKSLAAVFDIQIIELQKEQEMTNEKTEIIGNKSSQNKSQKTKGIKSRLINYILVIGVLFIINFAIDSSYIWAWWPALAWGVAIVLRELKTNIIERLFTNS